ncbi:uncharacterized protein LOC106165208 [Lingula anatina]|uniref:Uncharacterized protein LOC106165208 n=1 Tax=Lingula anatina TaxID=7574 RepID=A0A1S3IL08_LINAN|nr:uncharacterized protein LOC106165208 [Lingula anatina]|eukprot:XP_013398773.1 uncharacterized protein LOC106165208 [Lingula anatina]
MAALKSFLALVILGVALAQDVDICSDDDKLLEHGAMFRIYEQDCAKYYWCVLGKPIAQNCSQGTLFDAEAMGCLGCDVVDCNNRPYDPIHCFREPETTVDVNATTTPGPTPPPELLGGDCKDSRGLTLYALTNTTKAYMDAADGNYEIVSCGHDEFSITDCECVRPGVIRAKRKEILLNCEGTVTESSKVWVGAYGNVSLEDYNAQAGETSCRFLAGHLEIPHFMNRAFKRFTIAFFYLRDATGGGRMGLVNNGRATTAPSVQIYSEVNGLGGSIMTNSSEYTFYIDGTKADSRLDDGIWHHVVMACNGSTLLIYINGAERVKINMDGQPRQMKDSPMVIGVDRYADVTGNFRDTYFKGLMDNIVFYDVDLGEYDVSRLYGREDVPSPNPDQYSNPSAV